MSASFIQKIKKYHKGKDYINVKELADYLNIKVVKKTLDDPTCMGKVFLNLDKTEEDRKRNNIAINSCLNRRESNTVLAIMISKFILHYEKLINNEKVEFDIFSFKEIRREKFSKDIQLATRLVIPEKVLLGFDDLKYDRENYANKIEVNIDFISTAIKDHSLEFLICNNMIWKEGLIV